MSRTAGKGAGGRPTTKAAADERDASQTLEERHEFISVAAFYLAECRGFEPGCHKDDWLAAEKEIEAQYG